MRRVAAAVLAVVTLFGLSSCASADIKPEDAYKIGCPLVDAAVTTGSVASKATVAGLKKLRDSGALDPEPKKWLDAVISVLDSADPKKAGEDTKNLIRDGCAKHGYPLHNL
jgi:hypothetical protein